MRGQNNPMAWFSAAARVMEDPSASDWLKQALSEALNRDPIEADKDATALQEILRSRVAAKTRRSRPGNGANGSRNSKSSAAAAETPAEHRPGPSAAPESSKAIGSAKQPG